jgi:RND family efflux transporter MFP subunit
MKFILFPIAQSRRFALVAAMATLVFFDPTPSFAADSVVVEIKDVAIGFPAEATVEAVRQATVAAQIPGRILDIRVDAGQRVKQGEVLMRIDAREAAGGDAAAQANLVQARASFERTRNLHAQKFVSQAALDQAEAAYKAAQGSAGASGATYSHATVTAPIAGVIAERLVQVGEMAAPGTPLVTVFDPKGLRVIASIPQSRLAAVKRAGEAWVEFPEVNLTVPARRIEVLPSVDAKSHTATARLYLPDNIEGIVPGMAARAYFATGQAKKLTVPLAAVVRRGEITAVYIVDETGAGRLRQVRLGELAANGELEVLAGVNSGERVSLDPIKTGIAVHAKRAQSSAKP